MKDTPDADLHETYAKKKDPAIKKELISRINKPVIMRSEAVTTKPTEDDMLRQRKMSEALRKEL